MYVGMFMLGGIYVCRSSCVCRYVCMSACICL